MTVLLLAFCMWGWVRWPIWQHRTEQQRLETEIKYATVTHARSQLGEMEKKI